MRWNRWVRPVVLLGLTMARTAGANTVLAPWATPATGWLAMITSIWVPIIFSLLTIALLVVVRVMGDQEEWISKMLNMLIKASLAANALSIVGYFTLGTTTAPAATLDEVLTGLEGILP